MERPSLAWFFAALSFGCGALLVVELSRALRRRAKKAPGLPQLALSALVGVAVPSRHRDLGTHIDAEALAHLLGHASLAWPQAWVSPASARASPCSASSITPAR